MRERPPRRLALLRSLPALLGASLLVLCWAHLAWNASIGSLFPGLYMQVTMPAGLAQQAPPVLSWANVLDGAYQRVAAGRVGTFSPIYEASIQWKNQIYYSLLGTSATSTILVGPKQQLVEVPYVQEYCSRNAVTVAAVADPEARRIRAMQDAVEARGQVFVYLLTPSKPAVYPSVIPKDYPCDALPADRDAKLPLWRAALHRAGVHVADAAGAVFAARDSDPLGLFPRGGIHWNQIGAALGAQALIEAVNAQRPLLTPFAFGVSTSTSPVGTDRDLYDILNLIERDPHYPVPVLTYRRAGPAGPCRPARIVEVAGSFVFEVNDVLMQAPCAPEISVWWYWDNTHFLFPPGLARHLPVNAAERTADLRSAQIVVLEENEQFVPGSEQMGKLAKELLPQTAGVEH